MKEVPILFKKKEDCCGCSACINICSKQAIIMKADECGFIYPEIDEDKCIRCGLCKKVCAFQNKNETNFPIECFAAVSKNKEQAEKSASAGIFAALATQIIENGGIVYGAAFDDSWKVRHVAADTIDKLRLLQGSKYAHSDMGKTYSEIEEQLYKGRQVLFSGTPCQVAGLMGYLRKDYSNLVTVDIVCHGVPSNQMLCDYIKVLERKYGTNISCFTFRDKSIGWGINGSAVVNGKKVRIWQSASSFLYFFGNGSIYRENCYKCKYASSHRPGDITIGDFWGIEKQHPDWINNNGWDESKGISLLIGNTLKGVNVISLLSKVVDLKKTTFDSISAGNEQLNYPSKGLNREEVIDLYRTEGWDGVNKMFLRRNVIKRYSSQLKALLPQRIKRIVKRYI